MGSTERQREHAEALWQQIQGGEWPAIDGFVLNGRRFLRARRAAWTPKWSALSAREREVVAHAAQGGSNKTIAAQLGLATSTVGGHITRAMRKIGVTTRTALLSAWSQASAG